MKWPLHPIAPSTEVLVNPLPVNPHLPPDYATRLEAASSGLSGHAAGVPAATTEAAPLRLPR